MLLIFVGLFVTLWMKSPGKAEPITDLKGNIIEGSISVIEKIDLGGQEQFLIIRGTDITKPVMLFLHGGPGSPEISFMKHYNTKIEEDFVMVYWEQRGSGKSYSTNISVESMNIAQFISDTRELSEYLAKRFSQDKIYIMGHSWGSLLGLLTVHRHPELFYAYLGVGQVAYQFKGEQLSFEWVREQALARNDIEATKVLSEMSFPDSLGSKDEWMNFLMTERSYVMKYGGAMRGISGMWPMIKMVLNTSEYTIADKFNYMKGNLFSIENLWMDVITTNLFVEIDSLHIPAYFYHGIHDYQTPHAIAKDFYDQLKAPNKAFFSFENSAHSPIMEEAEKFNSLVEQAVKENQ